MFIPLQRDGYLPIRDSRLSSAFSNVGYGVKPPLLGDSVPD